MVAQLGGDLLADSLLALLSSDTHMITLIGGGGKTSLMYALAAHYIKKDIMVVATTTTKLYPPKGQGHYLILAQTFQECVSAVKNATCAQGIMTLAHTHTPEGKITGIDSEWLDQLAQQFPEIMIIVEADGSKGKSLKGHLSFEPVIPKTTGLLMPVVGIDGLGKLLTEQHVHRAQRVVEVTGAPYESLVTQELIIQLLLHPLGYLHNYSAHAKMIPVINKVDDSSSWVQATGLRTALMAVQDKRVVGCIISSVLQDQFDMIIRK